MRNIYSLMVLLVVVVMFSIVWSNPTPYATYLDDDTPAMSAGFMTHDDALAMCEDAGLIYDYEAEGTTTFELCYE